MESTARTNGQVLVKCYQFLSQKEEKTNFIESLLYVWQFMYIHINDMSWYYFCFADEETKTQSIQVIKL